MLRRLEELDRLDARARVSDEVLWPEDLAPGTGQREWVPPGPTSTGHTWPPSGRRSSWWSRHGSTSTAVLAVMALVFLIVPRIPGWVEAVYYGDPEPVSPRLAAPVARPDGRLLPAVEVGAAPAPSTYAFLQTQPSGSDPVTFDPCEAIHYVIRDVPEVQGASPADLERRTEVVHRAVARISAASGLAFVYDGPTTEAPSDERPLTSPLYASTFAPVLVAWSDPEETPRLEDLTVGVGGGRSLPVSGGRLELVTGMVRLDTPDLGAELDTRHGREYAEAVVVHELAHVLGAGHAEDDRELMGETTGPTELGEGDRYVLSRLGQGPCLAYGQ